MGLFTDAQLETIGVFKGVRGDRIEVLGTHSPNTMNTTTVSNIDILGDGTNGHTMMYGGRMAALYVDATINTQAAGLVTFTAYKGSIAAGNKVFEIILDNNAGAAGTVVSAVDVSVNNAGKDSFVAGDEIFLQGVSTAILGNAFRSVRVGLVIVKDI